MFFQLRLPFLMLRNNLFHRDETYGPSRVIVSVRAVRSELKGVSFGERGLVLALVDRGSRWKCAEGPSDLKRAANFLHAFKTGCQKLVYCPNLFSRPSFNEEDLLE